VDAVPRGFPYLSVTPFAEAVHENMAGNEFTSSLEGAFGRRWPRRPRAGRLPGVVQPTHVPQGVDSSLQFRSEFGAFATKLLHRDDLTAFPCLVPEEQ
jgi:hypothetical protein